MEVEKIVEEAVGVLGERPRPVPTRAGQPWVGLTTERAIHIAYDERTRARVATEAARLTWAQRCRIPVPRVIDARAEWLITERAVNDGTTSGRAYVSAAVVAAGLIAAAPEPPPSLRLPVAHHGGGWRAGAVRLGRLLRSPLSVAEFRATRAAAAALPRSSLAHGDYVLHNILFDGSRGAVTLIDWEFLTAAPPQQDLLMLWPRLSGADDRAFVLDEVLRTAADRRSVGVLHHWLCVRYLADLGTKTAPARWPPLRIEAAAGRLAEARVTARRLT